MSVIYLVADTSRVVGSDQSTDGPEGESVLLSQWLTHVEKDERSKLVIPRKWLQDKEVIRHAVVIPRCCQSSQIRLGVTRTWSFKWPFLQH